MTGYGADPETTEFACCEAFISLMADTWHYGASARRTTRCRAMYRVRIRSVEISSVLPKLTGAELLGQA